MKNTRSRHNPNRARPKEAKARRIIRERLAKGEDVNVRQLGEELGISHVITEQAAAIERAVQKALAEANARYAALEAVQDSPLLTLNKRQERQLQRRLLEIEKRERELDATIAYETHRQVRDHIEQVWLPGEKQRISEMEAALAGPSARVPFTNAEYRLLLAVLHPDNSASIDRRSEALRLVRDNATKLRGVDPSQASLAARLPTTLEELLARRRRA